MGDCSLKSWLGDQIRCLSFFAFFLVASELAFHEPFKRMSPTSQFSLDAPSLNPRQAQDRRGLLLE
jgi:hypothetical protein